MIITKLSQFKHEHLEKGEIFFQPTIFGCSSCGYAGRQHRHGGYFRNIITDNVSRRVKIFRVKCPSCGKTHAIIPDYIVPYFQHSYDLIKNCLAFKYLRNLSYSKIFKHFNKIRASLFISPQLLNFFIRRFRASTARVNLFFSSFTSRYPYTDNCEASVINNIIEYDKYYIFTEDYFNHMPLYFMAKI